MVRPGTACSEKFRKSDLVQVLIPAYSVICFTHFLHRMSVFQNDTSNIPFQSAANFINQSNRSVFLTGKAGTGKTTFLKYIKQHTTKQTAVVAPTGVAAINAGGVTIHSFFQLPFTPFIPERRGFAANNETTDRHNLLGRIRFNNEKRKLLQQLELLIIDEISMVRCDVLDAIDVVLRYFRNRQAEPFGGLQVLLIGDMYQLPPVVPNEEWNILSQFYDSPFFFSSRVMQQQQIISVELNKIYRQSDYEFIQVLNQVRNNEMDDEGFQLLHHRYQPAFQPKKEDGYIILTTHNYKADSINGTELNNLSGSLSSFKAIIEGEFYEKSYPADETLQLKVGAQAMFIKNDSDKPKRFFNGKIGIIKKIADDIIHVQCKDESTAIEVKKEIWKNVRYTLNAQTQQVKEEPIGSFSQYPLRLAWAITIHKSQGLTFEKAMIDAGSSFAPGQVYVALSRCTCLSGMILLSRINTASLQMDERILQFIKTQMHTLQLQENLSSARNEYQQMILMGLFNFNYLIIQLNEVKKLVQDNAASFNAEALQWLETLTNMQEQINITAQKFQTQLQQLLQQDVLPEENAALQKRLIAASQYFSQQLQFLLQLLPQSPAVTDSKQHALAYNEAIKDFHSLLSQKLYLINSVREGFSINKYHEQKKEFVLQPLQVNAYAGATYKKTDSPHPILHRQLRLLRDKICFEKNMPIYLIAGSNTLDEMASYLPQTTDELLQISGFGKSKVEKFGNRFLEIIINYSSQNNLYSLIHEKKPKRNRKEKNEVTSAKQNKPDTKFETYKLYKQGKTVAEIAAERNFTAQTIEAHLAHFVQNGTIKVDELVSREKFVLIEPVVKDFSGGSITPIKQQLGDDVSFGEIRLVMAAVEFERNNNI